MRQPLVFKRGCGRQHAVVAMKLDPIWVRDRPRLACNLTGGVMSPKRSIFRGVVTCKRCLAALAKESP